MQVLSGQHGQLLEGQDLGRTGCQPPAQAGTSCPEGDGGSRQAGHDAQERLDGCTVRAAIDGGPERCGRPALGVPGH